MISVENQLSDAKDFVEELRNTIESAVSALEELEGLVSDADCHDGLELSWTYGSPDVNEIINQLGLTSAEFSHIEQL